MIAARNFAQFGLEHLAVFVFGQRLNEEPMTRPLEAANILDAQAIKLAVSHLCAGTCHDKRDDDLAPIRIGRTNDRDLGETRMAQQDLLHLARVDVGSAGKIIRSFDRSLRVTNPSGLMLPMSPVCSHPSRSALALASG